MWPPMSSLLPWFFQVGGVVIATGLSIKMMDDYLDKDLDLHGNLYHFLEEGILPYALVALALAALADASLSVSLFLSAYCVGMVFSPLDRLPTGLVGYQECLLVMGIQLLFIPWRRVVCSLAVLLWVQILDDVIDRDIDTRVNIVHRLGFGEAVMIGGLCFFVGLYLDWMVSLWALVFILLLNRWQPRTAGRAELDVR